MGEGGKGSSPPACSPDFQPWPYCLSYLPLFKSKTSTHTRAHTRTHFCGPRKPLVLFAETLGLPPRAHPPPGPAPLRAQGTDGGNGGGRRVGDREGHRARHHPPPQVNGGVPRSLGSLSCEMGSPSASPTPAPRHGDRRGRQEGAFGNMEALGGGGREVLRTLGPRAWGGGLPEPPRPAPPRHLAWQVGRPLLGGKGAAALRRCPSTPEGQRRARTSCCPLLARPDGGSGGWDGEAEGLGACSTPRGSWGGTNSSS